MWKWFWDSFFARTMKPPNIETLSGVFVLWGTLNMRGKGLTGMPILDVFLCLRFCDRSNTWGGAEAYGLSFDLGVPRMMAVSR